ncbi:MAG: hypothetical protein EXR39_15585 [Betaproteobacteria bacterium]|nr:hypothetical protein [Betaproteobacteria bacterium]
MLLIQRIVGVVIGALALIAAVFFSVVIFAIVAVIAVCIVGYIWWKTRALRRAAKSMETPRTGRTIEATEIYEVPTEKIEDRTRPPNERP